MLYHPFPHDRILIDPTLSELRFVLEQARETANLRARVRTVKRWRGTALPQEPSGHWETKPGQPSGGLIVSVLGFAWCTGGDGMRHIRVIGGRVYPRTGVWGSFRDVRKARHERLVYPHLLRRIAAQWGHDNTVRHLLHAAETEQDRNACYQVLADRLEEMGAEADSDLLREYDPQVKEACLPPGADSFY